MELTSIIENFHKKQDQIWSSKVSCFLHKKMSAYFLLLDDFTCFFLSCQLEGHSKYGHNMVATALKKSSAQTKYVDTLKPGYQNCLGHTLPWL